MRAAVLLATAALGGCGSRSETRASRAPVTLRVERADTGTRLILTADSGWKINARIKPALETSAGTIVRFDAARLTPDSAYFAEPPTAVVGRLVPVRGTLRASVCAAGEQVCQVISLRVGGET